MDIPISFEHYSSHTDPKVAAPIYIIHRSFMVLLMVLSVRTDMMNIKTGELMYGSFHEFITTSTAVSSRFFYAFLDY